MTTLRRMRHVALLPRVLEGPLHIFTMRFYAFRRASHTYDSRLLRLWPRSACHTGGCYIHIKRIFRRPGLLAVAASLSATIRYGRHTYHIASRRSIQQYVRQATCSNLDTFFHLSHIITFTTRSPKYRLPYFQLQLEGQAVQTTKLMCMNHTVIKGTNKFRCVEKMSYLSTINNVVKMWQDQGISLLLPPTKQPLLLNCVRRGDDFS